MKLVNSLALFSLILCLLLDGKGGGGRCYALNLFLSAQQAQAFVADVKSPAISDPAPSTAEEIGVSVRPGEVEKEIQEEFIEDNSDPQEAALESEERTREKTEL